MRGPEILARTMSIPTRRGKSTQAWQYHSRSDSHSKAACWTLLFDLLIECDAVREAAKAGRIGFGINHVMVGPINKTLDLVVSVVPPTRSSGERRTFVDIANELGIALRENDRQVLADLPTLFNERADDIAEVAIALEAKACMTEHVKSMPRLHAEILATGYLAKLAAPRCITVSYSLVNVASTFVTPSGKGQVNKHKADDAPRVIEMLGKAIPMARGNSQFGYDVIGISAIDCKNDGSPVSVVTGAPAPSRADHVHYEQMIRSLCSEFRSRFRF